MKHTSLCLLYLLCCAIPLCAQDSAESIHSLWSKKLRSASSLKVVARSSALGNKRITILAARPQKYRIEMSDRVVVCNGVTVWNYSVPRNSVVVSRFKKNTATMSVETLLLDVLAAYKPVLLKNLNASEGGSQYLLRLEPAGEEKFGVRAMEIAVDRSSKQFRTITVFYSQGSQMWQIDALSLNTPVSATTFRFIPPKNCEVISMDNRD